MKKLVTLTLVALCSAALVRCSGTEETPPGADAGQTATDAGQTGTTDAGTNNGGDDAGTTPDSGIPPNLACDPVTAAGCPAGKKCSIESGPTQQNPNAPFVYACTDAGTKKAGEACVNEEDCDSGMFCLPVSASQAVCATFCYQDTDCPTINGNALKCKVSLDPEPGAPKVCGPDCDPISNTGCDAAQKCSIVSGPTQQNPNASVVFGCAPKGTKGDGETCANDGECQEKFFCAVFSAGASGKCTQFCANDSHCPTTNNQKCIGGLQGYPNPLLCQAVTTCDPLQQDCAGAGEGCYPTASGNVCAPSNNKDENVACAAANDCKPGLMCVNATGGPVCKKICNLTAGQEPSCAAGTCQGLQGQTAFGVCG